MPSVDVAVVGGGPAGAACAIGCAERGLSVALVERSTRPVSRPGESLHPGFEPLVDQLGMGREFLSAGFPRHTGHWVRSGDERSWMAYGCDEAGPWRGFQAWRSELDAMLLRRGEEVGVALHRPWGGARPVLEGGRVTGISGANGNVFARVVVDAAGGRHWLARHMGLAMQQHSPRLIARFGYARGGCPALDVAPVFCTAPEGWSWAAQVGEGQYAWTALALTAEGPMGPPQEFNALTPEGGVRRADVTWRSVSRPAGEGYFVVGDAAAVLDPASSHGVLRAVASGIKVAYLIARSLAGEMAESTVAHLYAEWMHRWVRHDIEALRDHYPDLSAVPFARRHSAQPHSPVGTPSGAAIGRADPMTKSWGSPARGMWDTARDRPPALPSRSARIEGCQHR